MRKTEFMKNIKIIVTALSALFLLLLSACGNTAAAFKDNPETETSVPDASVFTSVYSGMSDDERTAVWLGVSADGSAAVLCVFDTQSGRSKTWYGDFFDDGASVIITDFAGNAETTFGYKADGKESYLIHMEKYGEILISAVEPGCLASVIEEVNSNKL